MFAFGRIWKAIRAGEPAAARPPGTGNVVAPIVAARYSIAIADRELRQGEIISTLTHYLVTADPERPGHVRASGIVVPYAVVATPDCDLLHSFRAIGESKSERINGVLFFEAEEALAAKQRIGLSRHQWRDVTRNRMEGYHFLNDLMPGYDLSNQQIPDLLIDFKRYFMLPTKEVYRQCGLPAEPKAMRRCRLSDVWREDLQQRAMSFMQRVGTPDPDDYA